MGYDFELSCNGYTNWATWLVGLYADNDQDVYNLKRELLEALAEVGESPDAAGVYRFVKQYMPGAVQELEEQSDVGSRFFDVNWEELAEDWAAEWAEEVAYQEERGG